MSGLADYLMKYHFDAMAANEDVKAAALQVIQAQDVALEEISDLISCYVLDYMPNELPSTQAVIKWLDLHPTPPAQAGTKDT